MVVISGVYYFSLGFVVCAVGVVLVVGEGGCSWFEYCGVFCVCCNFEVVVGAWWRWGGC